jgi:hypothetical protein
MSLDLILQLLVILSMIFIGIIIYQISQEIHQSTCLLEKTILMINEIKSLEKILNETEETEKIKDS